MSSFFGQPSEIHPLHDKAMAELERSRAIPEWKEPRIWFIYRDPFGLFCFTFGITTVLFVCYVTQVMVLLPWFNLSLAGVLHGVTFQASVVFILWSYIMAAMTDPGTIRRMTASKADTVPPADDPERKWKKERRYCPKCKCIKSPRGHHCSTCQRCVDKMGAWDFCRKAAAAAAVCPLPPLPYVPRPTAPHFIPPRPSHPTPPFFFQLHAQTTTAPG